MNNIKKKNKKIFGDSPNGIYVHIHIYIMKKIIVVI